MKTISTSPEPFESTYALLMRSEEKQRSRFETLIYVVLIVSTMFAISQFGRQAAIMPPGTVRVPTVATDAGHHGV
jgi:hypothetical protein